MSLVPCWRNTILSQVPCSYWGPGECLGAVVTQEVDISHVTRVHSVYGLSICVLSLHGCDPCSALNSTLWHHGTSHTPQLVLEVWFRNRDDKPPHAPPKTFPHSRAEEAKPGDMHMMLQMNAAQVQSAQRNRVHSVCTVS